MAGRTSEPVQVHRVLTGKVFPMQAQVIDIGEWVG